MKKLSIFLILTLFLASSCVVPKKQYDELAASYAECLERRDSLSSALDQSLLYNQKLEAAIAALRADTARLGPDLRRHQQALSGLQEKYGELQKANEALKVSSASEISTILAELDETRSKLQAKEDALNILQRELEEKRLNLDRMTADMQAKEARLNELQAILDQKEAAVNALRKQVSDALLGFEGQGLSIDVRNGKVYVSLDENLLFATGKYEVNPEGRKALDRLANVLAENKDISVMIEGHTDNVPLKGSGVIKDNWDLSVMRATAVVRILTNNKGITPQRLTAAGRSEYVPVDQANTSEARAKNRRTEIILTPKLDELFRIIESN